MLLILTNSLSPKSMDSIVINELSSPKPITTSLPSDRSYLYKYWTLDNRLRIKNKKRLKRQQSSCRIVFYSLWLCMIAGVISIIIYRFTDECPIIINRKQFSIKCLRHGLFLATISISFLACSGVIFGTCRYFRSQPRTSLYNNEHELHLPNNNYNLLPIASNSCTHYYLKPLQNGASIKPSEQSQNHNEKDSNTTISLSKTNISLQQRKIPPFDYDELPLPSNSNIISKSFKINNNKNTAYSSTPNSYTTCVCGVDIWEKQQNS